jgi:hypothetical protein
MVTVLSVVAVFWICLEIVRRTEGKRNADLEASNREIFRKLREGTLWE